MAARSVALRLVLALSIASLLLCARAVDVATSRAVSSALNGAASKRSKQDGDNQTLVRVHIKQAPDPQFPVRPPAPPPQPPARTHPSVRLEPYAGGAVTQSAQLVPSVMQSCSQPPCCGSSPCSSQFTPPQSCGAPPCCGASPCSSLYGGQQQQQQPVPGWMANSPVPQYPSAPLTNYPMVQEYSRTVPGAPLVQPRTLDYNSNPQPLRVETEAASITMPVTPNVGWEGDRRVGVYSLESSPSVRIVGEDACGCPAGVDPCNDPCNKPETPRDKIENKLDAIKSQIVEDAEKIKDQNLWIKQVKHIIQHYNTKISAVKKDNNGLQSEVKRLFALKKHYEDLLLQFELDQDHFKKVEQWHSPDEIVVQQVADHQMPNTKLNCVEADSCDTPAGI